MKKAFQYFIFISAISVTIHASSQDKFMRLENNSLVTPSGIPITLKSVNLGGWLLWEGWIFGGGFTKESVIKNRLLQLLGREEYNNFLSRFYEDYITEKDIALIAARGFNNIRLPFNYRIFTSEDSGYIDGFKKIEEVIGWCKKYKLYLIPDMHAAPGGQNNVFTSDPDNIKLWSSGDNQQQTYELWMKIADRYKNDTTVAGYDLLNEPDVNSTSTLVNFYTGLVRSIRSVDKNHLLIIEGNKMAHSFKNFPAKFDDDQIYSYHYYAWFGENNKSKNIREITSGIITDLPFWCGEWGEDTRQNLKDIHNLLLQQPGLCGTSFWTWKRVYKSNSRYPVYSIHSTANWDKIMSWVTWKLSKPTKEQITKGIEEFLNAIKIENCQDNEILNRDW